VRGDVPHDDRAGTNQGAAPDMHGRDEHCTCTYRRAVLDDGAVPARRTRVGSTRAADVRECRAEADQYIGAENDAAAHAGMPLDPRAHADDGASGDERERSHDHVGCELSALRDHARGMNPGRYSCAGAALHGAMVCWSREKRPSRLAPSRSNARPVLAFGPVMALTYKQAGVDMDAGDELVERIKPLAAATRIAEVVSDIGGFAGLCRVPTDVEDPVLVSGTDGVGTKLKIAFLTGVHDTIGFDLVGMCVNDILTCGARPLFFLDYFATGKLDVGVAESVITGIAAACTESGCALLGGETAELPGMYAPGEYDLAGFAVGVVARKKLVDGSRVAAGDVALGLPASGLHASGFSLARAVLFETMKLSPDDRPPELDGRTLGQVLLTPTRQYARHVRSLLDHGGIDVRAMCHVTGGGLPGNLPRVLPEGLGLRVERVWSGAPIFDLIRRAGSIDEREMRNTFNLGVGFVFVVAERDARRATEVLGAIGESPIPLGRVVAIPSDRPFEQRVEWPT
jgi:phosphoribosylformylglycinamidine cyclo-ligase